VPPRGARSALTKATPALDLHGAVPDLAERKLGPEGLARTAHGCLARAWRTRTPAGTDLAECSRSSAPLYARRAL